MAALVCPHCDALSTFGLVANFAVPPRYNTGVAGRSAGVLLCANTKCQMPIVAMLANGEPFVTWPEHVGGKAFPDVPTPIASAADEAHRCLSIRADRAAVTLARAVVEALAKEHGITDGLLFTKIKTLAKQGVISGHMRDAADEIRFAGNEIAHGDLVADPLTHEEASEILALMDAILMRVYQEPAQVDRVRQRRRDRTTDAPSVQVEIS